MLSLALIQLCSTEDRAQNLETVARLVAEAAQRGAQLVALPENFSYLGPEQGKLQWAEPLEGPLGQWLSQLAARHGVWLLAGGLPECSPDPQRVYNTAVLYNAQGERVAAYRKLHLFDVDLPDGTRLQESRTVMPGDAAVLVDTPFGRLGLTICYDLRFPELYRWLALQGATLIFVPSAFTLYTGKDHWRVLLQARAIENTCYVAAPAQFGPHSPRRQSYGRSLLADPWGQVVAEAPDRVGITLAEVDLLHLQRIRQSLPSLQHCRWQPERYPG